MANKEKIFRLTKYQMRVLYYKCKEGATHEQIATILGLDVNTVQYHMTRIYTVLEIRQPGKSREEMESELQNEIGPIIREMFPTYDQVKIWAPILKNGQPEDEDDSAGNMDAAEPVESQAPYIPPPSVQKILDSAKNQARQPEIIAPPPPGRRRINWWLIGGLTVFGILSVIFWISYPALAARVAKPTGTPTQLRPTSTTIPTSTPVPTLYPTPILVEIIDPKDKMVLVYISAGEFTMGSPDKAAPSHRVYLDAYRIDKTEVTNAQYALCVADGRCTKPANNYSVTRESYYENSEYANYPVIYVSWGQAAVYCAWVDRRLPTEAEWEKAARGPKGFIYPWGNNFAGTLANYCDHNCDRPWKEDGFDDGSFDTAPVGTYPGGASQGGVMDLAGNVHEWVADWYAPYLPGAQNDPAGPATGQEKIMRGGSWGDDRTQIRSDVRSHLNPENWLDFIGFRCAR